MTDLSINFIEKDIYWQFVDIFRPSFILKYTLYFESNTNMNILLMVFLTNQIDLSKFITFFSTYFENKIKIEVHNLFFNLFRKK